MRIPIADNDPQMIGNEWRLLEVLLRNYGTLVTRETLLTEAEMGHCFSSGG